MDAIFRIQEKREGYLTKDFGNCLKNVSGHPRSFTLWVLAVVAMLYLDYQIFATDSRLDILQVLVVAGGILVAEIFTYAFPMESYFENSLKATVKNALLLGISNIPYTLLMLGINVFPFFLVARIPVTFGIWFLIGISGVAWINSFFLKKIFSKVRIRKDV